MNRKSKKNLRNKSKRNKSKRNKLKGGMFKSGMFKSGMFKKPKVVEQNNNNNRQVYGLMNTIKARKFGDIEQKEFEYEVEQLYNENRKGMYNLSISCGKPRFLRNLSVYFKTVTEFILYRETNENKFYKLKGELMRNPENPDGFLFSSNLDNELTLDINDLVNKSEGLWLVPFNGQFLSLQELSLQE